MFECWKNLQSTTLKRRRDSSLCSLSSDACLCCFSRIMVVYASAHDRTVRAMHTFLRVITEITVFLLGTALLAGIFDVLAYRFMALRVSKHRTFWEVEYNANIFATIATAIVLTVCSLFWLLPLAPGVDLYELFLALLLLFGAAILLITIPQFIFEEPSVYSRFLFNFCNYLFSPGAYVVWRCLWSYNPETKERPAPPFKYEGNRWTQRSRFTQKILLEQALSTNLLCQTAKDLKAPFKPRRLWLKAIFTHLSTMEIEELLALKPELHTNLSKEEARLFLTHRNRQVRSHGFMGSSREPGWKRLLSDKLGYALEKNPNLNF